MSSGPCAAQPDEQAPPPDPRDRYFARNLAWCQGMQALWGIGVPLVAPATILAVFLKHLGASTVLIGALPALQQACYGISQLPATRWTRKRRARLSAALMLYSGAGLWWLVAGVVALRFAAEAPRATIVALLGLFALSHLFMGAAQPAWAEAMGRMFSERRRGIAYGINWSVFGGFGILSALFAEHVLHTMEPPGSFALLITLGGVFAAASMQILRGCKEQIPPHQPVDRDEPPFLSVIRALWRQEPRLRRLVAARCIGDTGGSVAIFFAVHAVERFSLPDSIAGRFNLLISAAFIMGGLTLGRLGARRGFRRVLGWGMALNMVATLLALCAPRPEYFYAVFLFHGMAQTGGGLGTLNFILDAAPDAADRATPVALFGTLMAPVWLLGPIAAGALADQTSIPYVLAIGLALQVLGWAALLAAVDDPRRPGRRVLHWTGAPWRSWPRLVR